MCLACIRMPVLILFQIPYKHEYHSNICEKTTKKNFQFSYFSSICNMNVKVINSTFTVIYRYIYTRMTDNLKDQYD